MIFLLSSPGDLGFLIIIICTVIYFVPSYVAFKRQKRDFTPILLVNIFLGWTLIGWVVALIWSVSSDKKITDREKMLQLQEENNRLLTEIANQNKVSQINIKNVNTEDSEDLLEQALNTLEPRPDYNEEFNSIFPQKKPFYKNSIFIIISLCLLLAIIVLYSKYFDKTAIIQGRINYPSDAGIPAMKVFLKEINSDNMYGVITNINQDTSYSTIFQMVNMLHLLMNLI